MSAKTETTVDFTQTLLMFGLSGGDFSHTVGRTVKFKVEGDDVSSRQVVIKLVDARAAKMDKEFGPYVLLIFTQDVGPYFGLICYEDRIRALRTRDFLKINTVVTILRQ